MALNKCEIMNRLWAMMRMLIWPKIDRKPQPCKDRYVWKFLDANIWNNFHEIWATADNVWNMSDCRTARGWRKKHKLFWFFHLKIKYSVTINLDCCFDNKNKSEYSFFINKKETKNKEEQRQPAQNLGVKFNFKNFSSKMKR